MTTSGAAMRLARAGVVVREILAPEGPALDLAVVRITVAIVLSLSSSVAAAPEWAALPEAARTVPLGVGWLVPLLPLDVASVHAARVLFHAACVLGALGVVTQASYVVITISAGYLLLIPQLGGAVFHDHHLLWLAVILAASPCGDALSFDAWRAHRRGQPLPRRGRAHGLAVRLSWLVIGLVFFFPGVHKLAESGLAWALSDNLRNQMWWKWTQDPTLLPPFRIDRSPALCRTLAALTIAFELSFLPLVFAERTRALGVLGAIAFHVGAQVFMGIEFSVLWATYTMFVPWQALADRLRPRMPVPVPESESAPASASALPSARSSPAGGRGGSVAPSFGGVPAPFLAAASSRRALAILCATALPLFTGIGIAGIAGEMQAYPFACYPTFQWVASDHMPALAIEIEHADGHRERLDRALFQEPGPRGWALSWRLAGAYGAVDREGLEAWWRDRAARSPLRERIEGAARVRFSRVEISIDPDRAQEILEDRVILEL